MAFATLDSFANSNIVGTGEEGLLIDFGDTPLVDPATITTQPIHCHPNKLDLLFDDFEIPNLLPCPVTLPDSPVASSATISPGTRQSSMVDFSTTVPSQALHPHFTASTDHTATEMASHRPKTRAERAVEPHTVTKPNWALAPSIHRPIFTKEPRSVHFKANSPLPKYSLPPFQAPSGSNLDTHGSISANDSSTAPFEKPMADPPHETTETPLSKPPASSIHPSRLRLLEGGGALSEAGSDSLETKEHTAKGISKEQITGANTVPVARMRNWGAGVMEDAGTRTSASSNADEKSGMGSRASWLNKDPSPHSFATFDAVPMGIKSVAPTQSTVQAAALPTPFKRQTYPVTVESEDEGAADCLTTSPPRQIFHTGKSSSQITNDNTMSTSNPLHSAPPLARPSALKRRAVAEQPYAQTNPFIDPETEQESLGVAKPRPALLQRMGIISRDGPSALAARRKLFIEEDGRTYDYFDQCADEEAYEEYEEEEHWTPPPRAGAKKVVIAGPIGREERGAHPSMMRTPAKGVVRIVEPGPPFQVQTRRRAIQTQEGEEDEEDGYVHAYPEEGLYIGTAASRRIPVSQAEHDPPPRFFARMQQGPLRHAAASRSRRVVIQAPPEADDVDEGIEKFRGLSIADRVQTPGPRRIRVVKVQ